MWFFHHCGMSRACENPANLSNSGVATCWPDVCTAGLSMNLRSFGCGALRVAVLLAILIVGHSKASAQQDSSPTRESATSFTSDTPRARGPSLVWPRFELISGLSLV